MIVFFYNYYTFSFAMLLLSHLQVASEQIDFLWNVIVLLFMCLQFLVPQYIFGLAINSSAVSCMKNGTRIYKLCNQAN